MQWAEAHTKTLLRKVQGVGNPLSLNEDGACSECGLTTKSEKKTNCQEGGGNRTECPGKLVGSSVTMTVSWDPKEEYNYSLQYVTVDPISLLNEMLSVCLELIFCFSSKIPKQNFLKDINGKKNYWNTIGIESIKSIERKMYQNSSLKAPDRAGPVARID